MNHLNVARTVAAKMGAVAVGGAKVPRPAGATVGDFRASLQDATENVAGSAVGARTVVARVPAMAEQAAPLVEAASVVEAPVKATKLVSAAPQPELPKAGMPATKVSSAGELQVARKSGTVGITPEKKNGKGAVVAASAALPVAAAVSTPVLAPASAPDVPSVVARDVAPAAMPVVAPVVAPVEIPGGLPVAGPIVAAGDGADIASVGPAFVAAPVVAPGPVQGKSVPVAMALQEPVVEAAPVVEVGQALLVAPALTVAAIPAIRSTEALAGPRVATVGKMREGSAKKAGGALKEGAAPGSSASGWNAVVEKPESKGSPVQVLPQKLEVHVGSGAAEVAPAAVVAPLLERPVVAAVAVKDAAGPVLIADGPALVEDAQTVQPDAMRTLASTAQTLEVGVASGTHGWLRVRAEMSDAGAVVASVVTSSPGSAEALHRGLPALHEFLAHEQVGNVSVEIARFQQSTPGQEAGVPSGLASQAGGLNGQAREGSSQNRQQTVMQSGGTAQVELTEGAPGLPFLQASGAGGGWLSVRV